MFEIIKKESFAVIGKESSTENNKNPAETAWKNANSNFSQVENLALKNKDGSLKGLWGLMSSFNRDFSPWEDNFSKGLYLAGIEVDMDAVAPEGWVKWIVKEQTYMAVEVEKQEDYSSTFFSTVYFQIPFNRYSLSGAVFDYTDSKTNKNYLYFPVQKEESVIYPDSKISKIAACGCHCAYCFFNKCGGCESENNFCSLAKMSPDGICLNIKCKNEKNLNGCYECDELEECKIGFYAMEQCAKSAAIFIKREGKEVFEETLKKAIASGLNYSKDFILNNDVDKQLELLYKYKTKK